MWQPIETAPKDGTIIDVWLGEATEDVIDFYCAEGTRRATDWHWKKGQFRPYMPGTMVTVFAQPTYWMPLPDPP
jgi:hypothetical protein